MSVEDRLQQMGKKKIIEIQNKVQEKLQQEQNQNKSSQKMN